MSAEKEHFVSALTKRFLRYADHFGTFCTKKLKITRAAGIKLSAALHPQTYTYLSYN